MLYTLLKREDARYPHHILSHPQEPQLFKLFKNFQILNQVINR